MPRTRRRRCQGALSGRRQAARRRRGRSAVRGRLGRRQSARIARDRRRGHGLGRTHRQGHRHAERLRVLRHGVGEQHAARGRRSQDKKGRFVGGLQPGDFTLRENGAVQKLDLVTPEAVPATFALLVDSSQSMAPRMDFVRLAARRIAPHLNTQGSRHRRAVLGRARRRDRSDRRSGDDAWRRSAPFARRAARRFSSRCRRRAERLRGLEGRRVIVLITDGFDENSKQTVDDTIQALLDESDHGVRRRRRRCLGRVAPRPGAAPAGSRSRPAAGPSSRGTSANCPTPTTWSPPTSRIAI